MATEISGGDIWKPTTAGETLSGWYVSSEANQGKDKNSMLYTLKKEDGSTIRAWGSFLLDEKMEKVEAGWFITIEFLGKKQPKTPAGREFKDWKVIWHEEKGTNTQFRSGNGPVTMPSANLIVPPPTATVFAVGATANNIPAPAGTTNAKSDDLPF